MAKLGCPCGYTISDNTDNLPYKGRILKDQDDSAYFHQIANRIVAYIAAVRAGAESEWLAEQFGEGYPSGEAGLVYDIISAVELRYSIDVYECESCGRLLVENGVGSNRFESFIKTGESRGILRSGINPAGSD